MNRQGIWEILGLDPTGDKRAVKKAYAGKCRTCHPEEHPEEFKRLRQAYEEALAYTDRVQKADGEIHKETDKRPKHQPGGGRENEEKEPVPSTEENPWEEWLREGEEGAAGPMPRLSPDKWEELLDQGTRQAEPVRNSQPENRTDMDCLLDQMRELEAFCRENPSLDEEGYQRLMGRWDEIGEGGLFVQNGYSPYFFRRLFSWMDEERGSLHMPTVVGLWRIYRHLEIFTGMPQRKYKRLIKKHPEISRLSWELFYYNDVWDPDDYKRHILSYGKPPEKAKEQEKPEKAEGGFWEFWREHRLLWKLLVAVLAVFLRFVFRQG
ncbi:MAG: J domain-containing protein [Hungatella sp.]|nr:J domain-containing protein [Hungatella sp.]